VPSKRPRLRDRLATEPRGRDAVYGQPPAVNRGPSTVDPPAPSWEEAHTRVTFYCPRELLARLEAEMGRSGRSKSRVIVDALTDHLA
jgi:hypothetical protein